MAGLEICKLRGSDMRLEWDGRSAEVLQGTSMALCVLAFSLMLSKICLNGATNEQARVLNLDWLC